MMGNSESKKIMVNGREVIDRTPAKKLNPHVKAQLLTTLKRDDIVIETKRAPGSDTFYIKDITTDKRLFSFDCAWDYGYYSITIGDTIFAEMDWLENDGNKLYVYRLCRDEITDNWEKV